MELLFENFSYGLRLASSASPMAIWIKELGSCEDKEGLKMVSRIRRGSRSKAFMPPERPYFR